jgi:hypothetical protein
MKLSLIYIASLALLFAACKKETTVDPTPDPPVAITKYVQSLVAENGDSTAIEFNIDKSVYRYLLFRAEGAFMSYTPSYESGSAKITKVEFTTDPSGNNSYVYQTITYNSMQQISLISFYNYDGGLLRADSLVYNGAGKLETIYYSEFNSTTNLKELRKKYIHTWDTSGNIIKQEAIDLYGEDGTTTTHYIYDTMINPALKVKGYFLVKFNESEVAGLLSANNILTSATTSTTGNYTATTNNTYTYDTDDYPTVMTLRSLSQYTGQDVYSDSVKLKLNYGQ